MALRVGLGPGQLEAVTILLLIGLLQSRVGKYESAEREGWRKLWGEQADPRLHSEFMNLGVPNVYRSSPVSPRNKELPSGKAIGVKGSRDSGQASLPTLSPSFPPGADRTEGEAFCGHWGSEGTAVPSPLVDCEHLSPSRACSPIHTKCSNSSECVGILALVL